MALRLPAKSRQKATVNSRAWTVLNTSESTALQAIQSYLDVLMRADGKTGGRQPAQSRARV
jgi:hypothetical protein